MNDAGVQVAAHPDDADAECRIHPRVNRVVHDPAVESIIDGAEVELAIGGLVFGDSALAH